MITRRLYETALGIALFVAAAPGSTAHAFTTGGHFIATERGLRRAGFDVHAIRHVQAANYNVDHVVNLPSKILTANGSLQRASNVSRFFHSDGLWHIGYVDRELAFIDATLKRVIPEAKARGDARAILSAIGIASHAIQDFYSHSNFADVDWQAWKGSRVVTMEDTPRDIWENPLLTGRWARPDDAKRLLSGMPSAGGPYGSAPEASYPRHGSSTKECVAEGQRDCGVNHDGARRRNNLVAILMAAEATFDLAERVKALVADANVWSRVTRPGPSSGTDETIERAQSMSMAAGQWGYEGSENYAQIVSAFLSTGGVTSWDVAWGNVLFAMWLAAPTGHATGGGADPFPPNNVQLFGLPPPTPASPSTYAGGYDVLWGTRRGALELGARPPAGALGATLVIDGKTYNQQNVMLKNGGLELRMQAPDGTQLTGMIYVTGPNRDISGYLRDGVAGVPDGFAGAKRKLDRVIIKPDVKAL